MDIETEREINELATAALSALSGGEQEQARENLTTMQELTDVDPTFVVVNEYDDVVFIGDENIAREYKAEQASDGTIEMFRNINEVREEYPQMNAVTSE